MEILPLEVITHIFEFLPSLEDRKAASLVCKAWYEAYQSPVFRRDEILEISSDNIFDILCEKTGPNRIYLNVLAKNVDLNKRTRHFWDRFGPNIKSLAIHSCQFTEKSFLNVILRCDDLQSLSIRDSRNLFMSGNFLEDEDDRIAIKRKLYGLKSLYLGYNRYMSDSIFVRFASICGNLQELHLPGCNISFHIGVYRKFYRNGHSNPSENVFTFPVILDLLRESAEKLKLLSFSNTLIDSDAVSCIAKIKNLNLKEFVLKGCTEIRNDGIKILSDFQLSLTHLDLSHCPRITDLSVLAICSRLIKLQYLSIRGCRAVTDLGISDLWRLTELSDLNISKCSLIRDKGIIKGLCRRQNMKLEKLDLSLLSNITDNAIVQMMEFLPNIRVLCMNFCFNAVTDRSVQTIFSSARYLRTLEIAYCEKVTDRGLTGIALESPSTVAPVAPEKHIRIPLGSKEEVNIVKDAKLKQDVEAMCESIGFTAGDCASSLSNLKNLQHLVLAGCNRITDVSLKYAFKLNDLRSLNLNYCHQITSLGLCYLCENNKAIETLKLLDCENLTDTGVFHIFKNLERLRSLALGSQHITEGIADYIACGCPELRSLEIEKCPLITVQALKKLLANHPWIYFIENTAHSRYE